ncbi:MAG: hypothetical protein HY319_11405 [Armatimonadetes bacterium]|nr:hypothetical protein [Armatimonadota bacterium]
MRTFALTALSTVLLLSAAAAEEFAWPKEPVTVYIRGKAVQCVWREGVPWARCAEAGQYFGVSADQGGHFNLAEAVAQKPGCKVKTQPDGSLDVFIASIATQSTGTGGYDQDARQRNAAQNEAYKQQKAQQAYAEAMAPRLVSTVRRYVTESDYIRAYAVIRNAGGSANESCTAVCEFQDWHGKVFATDQCVVPPLQPGQSWEREFYSMIDADQMAARGVIIGDKFQAVIRFGK